MLDDIVGLVFGGIELKASAMNSTTNAIKQGEIISLTWPARNGPRNDPIDVAIASMEKVLPYLLPSLS